MKITAEELISSMGWKYENTETSARFVAEYCVNNFYSEEEVLKFTQTILMQYKFGNTNIEQMDLLKETFQLFKNQLQG